MLVELDVGGTIYPTTRDTLSKCAYFRRMLDGTMAQGLKRDGRIFIDRNGEYFEYVLEFLRSGHAPDSSDLTIDAFAKVSLEFDFFGLPTLINTRKRQRDKDDLKPFWYDFLLEKIRDARFDQRSQWFYIPFNMDMPRESFVVKELQSKQRRDVISKIIKNDLNSEEEEIWSTQMNNEKWLSEKIKKWGSKFNCNGKSVEELRDKLIDLVEDIMGSRYDSDGESLDSSIGAYDIHPLWTEEKLSPIKHINLTEPEKYQVGHFTASSTMPIHMSNVKRIWVMQIRDKY